MPRSPQRRLSRRRLLGSGLRAGGALGGAGALAALAGACDGSDTPEVDVDTLDDRDPMDMDVLALSGLRHPGDGEDRVALTLRGRRIVEVGETPPSEVQALDLDGGYVIPGFIDSHVHLQFATPAAILSGGVTAVRDLGSNAEAAQALIGRTPLKIVIAGRILTPLGGYPTRSWGADGTAREVRGIDDVEAAVDEQLLAGATVIKVAMEPAGGAPMFDVDTLEAIVGRAREHGVRVTAHCGSSEALERCIAAGVRELAHLPLHDVSPAEMVAAADAGMILVPTLEIREDPEAGLAALRAFREAGGDLLYGSDLGNAGTEPGIEVREVELMLAAGMTPQEVLRSATLDPALYLGLDTGRLEAGKVADIVVLGGDPFADPRAYDDVRLVVASGEVVFSA